MQEAGISSGTNTNILPSTRVHKMFMHWPADPSAYVYWFMAWLELLQLIAIPLMPHVPWGVPINSLQRALQMLHIPLWDTHLMTSNLPCIVWFWVLVAFLLLFNLVILMLHNSKSDLQDEIQIWCVKGCFVLASALCTVLYIPAMRMFSAVGLWSSIEDDDLQFNFVMQIIAVLCIIVLLLWAILHKLLLYNMLPPPLSQTPAARAHGRMDTVQKVLHTVLMLALPPSASPTLLAWGLLMAVGFSNAFLFSFMMPYYNHSVNAFKVFSETMLFMFSLWGLLVSTLPAPFSDGLSIAILCCLPLIAWLAPRIASLRLNTLKVHWNSKMVPAMGLAPKYISFNKRLAADDAEVFKLQHVNEDHRILSKPLSLPVCTRVSTEPTVVHTMDGAKVQNKVFTVLTTSISRIFFPTDVELSMRFIYPCVSRHNTRHGSEESLVAFAWELFKRAHQRFSGSPMIRIHKAIMHIVADEPGAALTILRPLTRSSAPLDVRFHAVILQSSVLLSLGYQTNESLGYYRDITSIHIMLLRTMEEFWSLLMTDSPEPNALYDLTRNISQHRITALQKFELLFKKHKPTRNAYLLCAKFAEMALLNPQIAELAYQHASQLETADDKSKSGSRVKDESTGGATKSTRDDQAAENFIQVFTSSVRRSRGSQSGVSSPLLTKMSILPSVVMFCLACLSYGVFWTYSTELEGVLLRIPVLGDISRLSQDCALAIQTIENSTKELNYIADKLEDYRTMLGPGGVLDIPFDQYYNQRVLPVGFFDRTHNTTFLEIESPEVLASVLSYKCRVSSLNESGKNLERVQSAQYFVSRNVPSRGVYAFNVTVQREALLSIQALGYYIVYNVLLAVGSALVLIAVTALYDWCFRGIAMDIFIALHLFMLLPYSEVEKLKKRASQNRAQFAKMKLTAQRDSDGVLMAKLANSANSNPFFPAIEEADDRQSPENTAEGPRVSKAQPQIPSETASQKASSQLLGKPPMAPKADHSTTLRSGKGATEPTISASKANGQTLMPIPDHHSDSQVSLDMSERDAAKQAASTWPLQHDAVAQREATTGTSPLPGAVAPRDGESADTANPRRPLDHVFEDADIHADAQGRDDGDGISSDISDNGSGIGMAEPLVPKSLVPSFAQPLLLMFVRLLIGCTAAVCTVLLISDAPDQLHDLYHTTTILDTMYTDLVDEVDKLMIASRAFSQFGEPHFYTQYWDIKESNTLMATQKRMMELLKDINDQVTFMRFSAALADLTHIECVAMRLTISAFDLTNLRERDAKIAAQCQTNDCFQFANVIGYVWNASKEPAFNWDHYWHDYGWDWNTTRDLTGLHYSIANQDLALDRETQGSMARSILFDDKYDSVRGRALLALEELIISVDNLRTSEVERLVGEARINLIPVFVMYSLYAVVTLCILVQTRRITLCWRLRVFKGFFGLSVALITTGITLLVIYMLFLDQWTQSSASVWAWIKLVYNKNKNCQQVLQMAQKYTQFGDARALRDFRIRSAAEVEEQFEMQLINNALNTEAEMRYWKENSAGCQELERNGAIAIRIAAWAFELSDSFLEELKDVTWDRKNEDSYAEDSHNYNLTLSYTDTETDRNKDRKWQATASRFVLSNFLLESKYDTWKRAENNLLEVLRERESSAIHEGHAKVQMVGSSVIAISIAWIIEALLMILCLTKVILQQKIAGMEREMQAAGVDKRLSRNLFQCKLGLGLMMVSLVGTFTFTTVYSSEVSTWPMLLSKPCTTSWLFGNTLYYAHEVQRDNTFFGGMLSEHPPTELYRAARRLQNTYDEMNFGFAFRYKPGHELDPKWTIPIGPLVGRYPEIDAFFYTANRLVPMLTRWLELCFSLAATPLWQTPRKADFLELKEIYAVVEPELREMCDKTQLLALEHLRWGRILAIIALFVIALVLMLGIQFIFRPMTSTLLSENNATVDMLLLVPEEVRNSVDAIREYLEHGRVESEHTALRNALESAEKLVGNVFSRNISQRIKAGEYPIADPYKDVTILFSDLCGFTKLCSSISATDLVTFLDALYANYDQVVHGYGLQKIKTIGDAYFCVGNCTVPLPDAPVVTVRAASDLLSSLNRLRRQKRWKGVWKDISQRIGLHVGSVVGGVIGRKAMLFDLWGDAVNLASRMESTGEQGVISMSKEMYHLVRHCVRCNERRVQIPYYGEYTAYVVTALLVNKKGRPGTSGSSNAEFRQIVVQKEGETLAVRPYRPRSHSHFSVEAENLSGAGTGQAIGSSTTAGAGTAPGAVAAGAGAGAEAGAGAGAGTGTGEVAVAAAPTGAGESLSKPQSAADMQDS